MTIKYLIAYTTYLQTIGQRIFLREHVYTMHLLYCNVGYSLLLQYNYVTIDSIIFQNML